MSGPNRELYLWWRSTRPDGWTERQHLADPAAGALNQCDTLLAQRVVRALKFGESEI